MVRVIDGVMKKGKKIRMMGKGEKYKVERKGVFKKKMVKVEDIGKGEIGLIKD